MNLKRRGLFPLVGGATLAALPPRGGGGAQAAVTGVTGADGVLVNGQRKGTISTTGTIAEANVYDISTHGATPAKLDGVMGFNIVTSNGSATATSSGANFTAGDIGKTIAIVGAGAAGAHLVTTISAVGSSTSITLGATAGGASSTGWFIYGTDDTAAWQAASNAAAGSSIRIIGPAGISVIAGALQTGGNFNTQVKLPANPNGSNLAYTIEIVGPTAAPNPPWWQATIPSSGLILFSPIQGSGTKPAMIAAAQSGGGSTVCRLNVWNTLFRTMPDAGLCPLDGSALSTMSLFDCYFDTLQTIDQQLVAPINASGVGFYCPGRGDQCLFSMERVFITGYYTGFVTGECGYIDNVFVFSCFQACSNPAIDYPTEFGLLTVSWCPYGMVWTGEHHCTVFAYLSEHWKAPVGHGHAWMAQVYDFDTGGADYWRGRINAFYEVDAQVGRENELFVRGCQFGIISSGSATLSIQTGIATYTVTGSMAQVTNGTMQTDGGGDITLIAEPLLAMTGASGTWLIEGCIFDLTANAEVANSRFTILSITAGSSFTQQFFVSKTVQVRCPGPRGRTYALYVQAVTAGTGTAQILGSSSNSNGGSYLTMRPA